MNIVMAAIISGVGLGAVSTTALSAEGQSSNCAEGERYAPDGKVVELGSKRFWICAGRYFVGRDGNFEQIQIDRDSSL